MDRMSTTELLAYVKGMRRRGWQQTRRLAYFSLKPWSRELNEQDIMPLPWIDGTTPASVETAEEREDGLKKLRGMLPKIKEILTHGKK